MTDDEWEYYVAEPYRSRQKRSLVLIGVLVLALIVNVWALVLSW